MTATLFPLPEAVPVGGAYIYGQAPGRSSADPTTPFLGGRHGAFLAELAGVCEDVLADLFVFHNVLHQWPGKNGKGDAFPLELARERARLLRTAWKPGDFVLFAGRNVAVAFSHRDREYMRWSATPEGASAAVFPHPSRVNHWWNDRQHVAAAQRFMRDTVHQVMLQHPEYEGCL